MKNRAGETVCSGVTPQTINLKTSSGYFRGESYTLSFKKGGSTTTVPLDAGISPWYFGNFLVGGVIGMLVIDPLTGSMWTLEDSVAAQLGGVATNAGPGSLRIVERSHIPAHLVSHLKAVPANAIL